MTGKKEKSPCITCKRSGANKDEDECVKCSRLATFQECLLSEERTAGYQGRLISNFPLYGVPIDAGKLIRPYDPCQ